jgi:hypothetical protein
MTNSNLFQAFIFLENGFQPFDIAGVHGQRFETLSLARIDRETEFYEW